MQQSVYPGHADIRIMFDIPGAVEETVGIALFTKSKMNEMKHRRQIGTGDIRVARPIPIPVNKPLQHPHQFGFHRGGRSDSPCRSRHALAPVQQAAEKAM